MNHPGLPEAGQHQWPDTLDLTVVALYLAAIVAVPALGYVLMAVDYRRYLRSLRRFLAIYTGPPPGGAAWNGVPTPRCLAAFGLCLPCSEAELTEAYRQRIKSLHPDIGGDKRRFLVAQRQFEEALRVIREQPAASA